MSRIMSPTMLVDSWIDADQRLYEYCAYAKIASLDVEIISTELKQMVEEFYPDIQSTLFNKVDWISLAENLIKE
jgi:hypothetical protein